MKTLSLGFFSAFSIIALAISLQMKMKLSLHVAYSTLAIFIVSYTHLLWALVLCLFAIALCGSRLILKRHTRLEVLAGIGAGGIAGLILWAGGIVFVA